MASKSPGKSASAPEAHSSSHWPRFIRCCTRWKNADGSKPSGRQMMPDATAVTIASPRPAAANSPRCAKSGARSSTLSMPSQESTMPDWNKEVREHIANLNLPPKTKEEVIAELSAHLEDINAEP